MNRSIAIGVVLIVLVAGAGLAGYVLLRREAPAGDGLAPPQSETAAPVTDGPAEQDPPLVDAPSEDRERAPAAAADTPEARAKSAAIESKLAGFLSEYEVQGVVLDPRGVPVPDVEVFDAHLPEHVLARTGFDGRFRFATRGGAHELDGRLTGWATLQAGVVDRTRAERDALVVLAPVVAVAGRVLDAEGGGIPGAELALQQDWLGIAGFPLPLDDTVTRSFATASDELGQFAFEAVPRVPGRALEVRKAGFEPTTVAVPELARTDLEIRLERSAAPEPSAVPMVFGNVRFPDGAPAEGARVQLVQASTKSDRDGRFELARPEYLPEGALIVAFLEGWQPAVHAGLHELFASEPTRVGPIELALPGPALSIRGRLELADGSPAKKWSLRLIDATVLDDTRTPPPTLENGGEPEGSHGATDKNGRFELTGLADRAYTMRLWHPKSFVSVESGPVQAGEQELVLRVPEDAVLGELSGRVTTRGGAAVEGAKVSLQFITHQTRTGFSWETPSSTRTDADGAFVLRDVPRRRVNVIVDGAEVVTKAYEPPGGELDGKPLAIEVERLFRVQLDFSGSDSPPDSFQMLDAAGEQLHLETRNAHGRTSSTQMTLQAGQSGVVAVSEAAATLVLLREYEELERRPVVLAPGTVNELRP